MKQLSALILMVIIGCAPLPTLKPIISQAAWSQDIQKDRVCEICIAGLYAEGYRVLPRDISENGTLMFTQWKHLSTYRDCKYTIRLIVYALPDNKVIVNCQIDRTHCSFGHGLGADARINANNEISEDIDALFARINLLLGSAGYYEKDTVLFQRK